MATRAAVKAAVIAGFSLAANQAYAVCTFGGSGEPSLQTTLNNILGPDTVNAVTACINDGADATWETVGQVGTIDIQVELAGNASSNTFGIFDPISGNRIRLFEGNDGAGAWGLIRVRQVNSQWQVRVWDSNVDTNWTSWTNLSSSAFGFYLANGSNSFYSDTARNADQVDHMYAYGPLSGDFTGQYVMAWEDLAGGGDRDYQDFVATVTDITPVPLPTAVWLLGSGLIGLAGVARRRA